MDDISILKDKRIELKLNRKEVADFLKVSTHTVESWELLRRSINSCDLNKVIEIYELSSEELHLYLDQIEEAYKIKKK